MSGLDLSQLKALVVTPALTVLGAHFNSLAGINLIVGTALAESNASDLYQLPSGPAMGLWQMEPATHDDIWTNFLAYQSALKQSLQTIMSPDSELNQLTYNLAYGACMARIKYYRSPLPLPLYGDAAGMAAYHVSIYNAGGAANAAENTPLFQLAINA